MKYLTTGIARFALRSSVIGVIAVATLTGCRKEPPPVEGRRSQVEPGFAEQLELGRSGGSDRITLSLSSTDDQTLDSLSVQDDWIETMILDAGVITDRGAEAIARLPNLLHLRLRLSPIGDAGLAELARSESIEILNLPQCEATAKGIRELSSLPRLRSLRIGGKNLSSIDPGPVAEAIASLRTLRSLHLIGVPIDNEGLRRIASLPKLRSLYLDDSAVTEPGWDWLFETHPEFHVHVNQQHHDRDRNAHDKQETK